jgi:hypothetical protein
MFSFGWESGHFQGRPETEKDAGLEKAFRPVSYSGQGQLSTWNFLRYR